MKNLTIHSKPDEIQAYHTERTADSLEVVNSHLHNLNKSNLEIKPILEKIASKDEQNLSSLVSKLDEVTKAVKAIPKVEIPEPKEFPEIEPTDMSETNRLLNALLNKEEKEIEFPEQKEVDFTETNGLLKKLLAKEDDDEISVIATLEII